jgi:hypothetical protein
MSSDINSDEQQKNLKSMNSKIFSVVKLVTVAELASYAIGVKDYYELCDRSHSEADAGACLSVLLNLISTHLQDIGDDLDKIIT